MSSGIKVFTASLALALCAIAGQAQQPQNPTQNQQPQTPERQGPFGRGEGRGFRGGHGPRGLFDPRLMNELNLTDDQRRQIGDILAANFDATRSQREELGSLMSKRQQGTLTADEQTRANALREQLRTSMKDSETKIGAILTPDQKTKLETIMKERRENRERFGRRRGPLSPNGTEAQPQKPTTPPND